MNRKPPLVSIIIPVYNAEKYVANCIEAVLAQSVSEFELILIDDGSNDSTNAICEKYAEKDNRIRYYKYENAGVSVARNRGIEKAEGTYTVFADADDIICENQLEVLLSDVQEYNCDIVMAGFYEWRSAQCIIPRYGTGKKQYLQNDEVMYTFLADSIIHSTVWAKLFRTDLVKEVKFPVGIAIAEDLYFIYLILKKCSKVLIHDVCLYKYKITENSAMASTISNKNFDAFKIYKKIREDSALAYPCLKTESDKFFLKNYLWQLRYIHSINSNLVGFAEKIKKIEHDIRRYNVQDGLHLLEKKQWAEYMIVKVTPFLYQPYIRSFNLYQKVQRKKQKM